MKRIIYIGDFKEFWATENYIASAFEELGYDVIRVDQKDMPSANAVLGVALRDKPEFVMFSKWNGASEIIRLLKENKILTIGWIFDLYFDLPPEFGHRNFTNGSFQCDICFITDGGHDRAFAQAGVNAKLLRQGVHGPGSYIGQVNKDVAKEVIFLGSYNYEKRRHMIDWLKQIYKDQFLCYGMNGDKDPVRGKDLNDLLASVSIVVGDSVPSPFYWSNRIYEVLGRGGFLLHPKVEGLDKEFIDGKHYVSYTYGDYQDLKQKIDYYLDHADERIKIQMQGHNHVKGNFTYKNRCRDLLKEIVVYKSRYHKYEQ